jgi:hypothetical protein
MSELGCSSERTMAANAACILVTKKIADGKKEKKPFVSVYTCPRDEFALPAQRDGTVQLDDNGAAINNAGGAPLLIGSARLVYLFCRQRGHHPVVQFIKWEPHLVVPVK